MTNFSPVLFNSIHHNNSDHDTIPNSLLSSTNAKSNEQLPPPNIRNALTLRSLMAANLHLGHATNLWNPYMLSYIYGSRSGIHIINLEHTLVALKRAINVTREVTTRGGSVLFVGTRPAIHHITVEAAKVSGVGVGFFATKWIGGTLTNRERVLRRSSGYDPDKVSQVLPILLDEMNPNNASEPTSAAAATNTAIPPPTSQPHVYLPDLLVILDMPNNLHAIREAHRCRVPVIAICDTDCDPRMVTYPIPANDDSLTGIELISGVLALAAKEGAGIRKRELKNIELWHRR